MLKNPAHRITADGFEFIRKSMNIFKATISSVLFLYVIAEAEQEKLLHFVFVNEDNIHFALKSSFLPGIKIRYREEDGICKSSRKNTEEINVCDTIKNRLAKIHEKFTGRYSDSDSVRILVDITIFNEEIVDMLSSIAHEAGFAHPSIFKMNSKSFILSDIINCA